MSGSIKTSTTARRQMLDDLKPDLRLQVVFREEGISFLQLLRDQFGNGFLAVDRTTMRAVIDTCERGVWANGVASRTFLVGFRWNESETDEDYFERFSDWFESAVAPGVQYLELIYD